MVLTDANDIVLSELHPSNAIVSIEVVAGKEIFLRLEQDANAESPIVVAEVKVTDVNEEQFLKALLPIIVTFGKLTDVINVHPENADALTYVAEIAENIFKFVFTLDTVDGETALILSRYRFSNAVIPNSMSVLELDVVLTDLNVLTVVRP